MAAGITIRQNANGQLTYRIGKGLTLNAKDPLGIGDIQRSFISEAERRFAFVSNRIEQAIEDDSFDLFDEDTDEPPTTQTATDHKTFTTHQISGPPSPPPNSYDFPRKADAVDAFMEWLDEVVQAGVVERTTVPVPGQQAASSRWMDVYLRQSYSKGVKFAETAAQAQGMDVEPEDIQGIFQATMHADAAGLLFTRAYDDLDGITNAMQTQIRRELTQGLLEGHNPVKVARNLADRVDKVGRHRATLLARTETSRAMNEATLNRYQTIGADEIQLLSEFNTAGDNNVCQQCQRLAGKQYTLDEAHGVIPVHVQCRCGWIPIIPDEPEPVEPVEPPTPISPPEPRLDDPDTIPPELGAVIQRFNDDPKDTRNMRDLLLTELPHEDVAQLVDEQFDGPITKYVISDIVKGTRVPAMYSLDPDPSGLVSVRGQDREEHDSFIDFVSDIGGQHVASTAERVGNTWSGWSNRPGTRPFWEVAADKTGNTLGMEFLKDADDPTDITDREHEAVERWIELHADAVRQTFGDEIPVFRGIKRPRRSAGREATTAYRSLVRAEKDGNRVEFPHRTIESWSIDPHVAMQFASYGDPIMMRTVTPEEIVTSSFYDDLMARESEFVVMGGTHTYEPGEIAVYGASEKTERAVHLIRHFLRGVSQWDHATIVDD